jgi:hypothetical protein
MTSCPAGSPAEKQLSGLIGYPFGFNTPHDLHRLQNFI